MKRWRHRSKGSSFDGTLESDSPAIPVGILPDECREGPRRLCRAIPVLGSNAVVGEGKAGSLCLDPLPRQVTGHSGMEPIKLVRPDPHQTKPTGA